MDIFKKAFLLSFPQVIVAKRCISSSSICFGKRNFRKFQYPNKRGNACDKEFFAKNFDAIDHRGQRLFREFIGGKLVVIPEKIPELMVPDLTDFQLKPYVSYRAPDVVQTEFTALDLFNAVYSEKITKDFDGGKLDEEGNPFEPSNDEKLTQEEARLKARQTGCDLFG